MNRAEKLLVGYHVTSGAFYGLINYHNSELYKNYMMARGKYGYTTSDNFNLWISIGWKIFLYTAFAIPCQFKTLLDIVQRNSPERHFYPSYFINRHNYKEMHSRGVPLIGPSAF